MERNAKTMQETWKTINDYDGLYEISNTGKVKSFYGKFKILKNCKLINGYLRVGLCKTKKQRLFLVHRLVAKAFIPNHNNYPQVNHKNGIKNDNYIENLEWVTRSQNVLHAHANGLISQSGEKNAGSKLKNKDILDIRRLYKTGNFSQRKIAAMFAVSGANVFNIVNSKTWINVI